VVALHIDGSHPGDAVVALWSFGYACVEHGGGYLAVRLLARALDWYRAPHGCSASWCPSSKPTVTVT
jgi:hypothetical protein